MIVSVAALAVFIAASSATISSPQALAQNSQAPASGPASAASPRAGAGEPVSASSAPPPTASGASSAPKPADANPAATAPGTNPAPTASAIPSSSAATSAGTGASAALSAGASDAKPTAAKPTGEVVDAAAKKICSRYYPSRLQGAIRAACTAGAQYWARAAQKSAQIRCRLEYGLSPSATMACFVGVAIAEDLAVNPSAPEDRRRTCAAHYPAHTEIDSFLQESCLAGLYMPRTISRSDASACREVSPERSFLGPCETGISLSQKPFVEAAATDARKAESSSSGDPAPNAHAKLCDRYFDHRQLHQGYRACLNARGLAVRASPRLSEALTGCEQVASDAKSDLEKAACLVGFGIARASVTGAPLNPRFDKCGEEKVSYRERNALACLTAASLLELGDRREAERGCKAVFAAAKSASRGDCERAAAQL